jgi:transposase
MPERNGGTSMPSAPASAPGWSSAAWTHGRTHHAAVIDQQGRLLGDQQFPADRGGYRLLLSWLRRHGNLDAVGVEATGSYGAGLTRYLLDQHVADIS